MHKVAVSVNRNHYLCVLSSLELLEPTLPDSGKILIKPNICSHLYTYPIVTHVDCIKAIIRYLKNRGEYDIYLGEASFTGKTSLAVAQNRFNRLGLKILDFNNYENIKTVLFTDENTYKPKLIEISDLSDFDIIISTNNAKTDIKSGVSLSIKNMLGTIKAGQRYSLESIDAKKYDNLLLENWYRAHNENLFTLYNHTKIDIAIVDAFYMIEKNGPIKGVPKKANLCISSTSALWCDTVATQLMGFDPGEIPYLRKIREHCEDRTKYSYIGPCIESIKKDLEPPTGFNFIKTGYIET